VRVRDIYFIIHIKYIFSLYIYIYFRERNKNKIKKYIIIIYIYKNNFLQDIFK